MISIRPIQLIRRNSVPLGLTTRIVMQSSVGTSLKATLDRFAGAIGGTFRGVCVLLAVPHGTPSAMGLALAITMVPLALLAAFKPFYRFAPITGFILLLTPTLQGADIRLTGLNRILEVGVGSVVAVLVSLVVLPARAHETLTKTAGRTLELLADLLDQLSKATAGHGDPKAIFDLHGYPSRNHAG